MNDAVEQRLAQAIAPLTEHAPGARLQVAICRGAARWQRTWPNDDAARFLIYSVTKSFIAALILRSVEAGLMALDAPLATYLPKAPHADAVTIRQLLRHSSGMPDYGGTDAYHASVRAHPDLPWGEADYLACATTLAFAPDTGWRYSNIGYMLLKHAIEHVHGHDFGIVLRQEILNPLGMISSSVPTGREGLLGLVPGYSRELAAGSDLVDVRGRYHPGWVSHGVIASTAMDVARFFAGLFTGAIIQEQLLREMTTLVRVPGNHPPFKTPSYGLGLMADPGATPGPAYGHVGGGPGYRAAAFHFAPEGQESFTIAALANVETEIETTLFDIAGLVSALEDR